MNSYSRLEINLLPPELQPGPAIRYAFLINFLIIMAAVAIIGVSAYISWQKLMIQRELRDSLQTQVDSRRHIEKDFLRLDTLRKKIAKSGKLVQMASEDYVDMPVAMNMLSKIVPDGVYLERVVNQRNRQRNVPVNLIIVCKTSKRDPRMMIDTLNALKNEPMFRTCFLPAAEFEEITLNDLMTKEGIDWSASGTDVTASIVAEQYVFEIHALLDRPLAMPDDLNVVHTELDQFASLTKDLLDKQAEETEEVAEENPAEKENQ